MKTKINSKLGGLSAADEAREGGLHLRPRLKWSLVINGIKCKKLALCSDQKMTRPETEFWNLFTTANRMAAKIVHITLTFDWGGSCILLLNAASVEECLYFYFYFFFYSRFHFHFCPRTKRDLRTCCYLCKKFCADTAAYKGADFGGRGVAPGGLTHTICGQKQRYQNAQKIKLNNSGPYDPFK